MKSKILVSLMAVLFAASAMAATNPTAPGPNSTGTFDINFQVGTMVKVAVLGQDMTAPLHAGDTFGENGVNLERYVCVYSNQSDNKYNITFISQEGGSGNKMLLVNDRNTAANPIQPLPYELNYIVDGASKAITTNNQVVKDLTGTASVDCLGLAGRANGLLQLVIKNSDGVSSGNYNDTLSLLVTPGS